MSLADYLSKKYSHLGSDIEIVFARVFFSLPVLWALAIFEGVPEIDPRIIPVFLLSPPLELLAMILYMRSLRLSPLSLTVPFQSFTPAFLLITSYIMLKEVPGFVGMGGVLLIVAGAYTLNISTSREGFFTPFKMIYREKGSWLMLIVAFIFSITANFGKMGVIYSSPIFFGAVYFSIVAILLFSIIIFMNYGSGFFNKVPGARIRANLSNRRLIDINDFKNIFRKEFVLIGIASSFMIAFHVLAVKLIYVSYMISIKRSSILISIIFGALLLNEKNIKEKIIGGILMVIGILVITLSG